MSGVKIVNYKYDMLLKQLEERTMYMKHNCIMNRSMTCKKKWMEIKHIHNKMVELEKVKSDSPIGCNDRSLSETE